MDSPFKADVLDGKVAIVTGGGSGIGLEISRHLGTHGCKVLIAGRRENVLQQAVKDLQGSGCEATYSTGDVRKSEDCRRWVSDACSKWGSLDILVNCAAGNFLSTAEELTVNGFRTVMEIDAVGTFNMSNAAFSALENSGDGRIINISATLHYGATWYQVHASAAKAAVDSITRTLALEWGHYGIKVNGVAPGPIEDTAGMSKLAPETSSQMQSVILDSIPLGRMGTKADIALACVFLSSKASSYMSGHVMVVDGANWMWRPQVVPRAMVTKASRGVEAASRNVGIARSKL